MAADIHRLPAGRKPEFARRDKLVSSSDRLERLIRGRRLTVGVAAKFQWRYLDGTYGPALIAASERMLTTGLESNPIEHTLPVRKGTGIGSKAYLLVGGAIQIHSQLLRELLREFPQEAADEASVWDLANAYARLFRKYRQARAEERYLTPVGLTLKSFIQNATKIPEQKALETWSNLENYSLDYEALFLGYDVDATAVLEVTSQGTVINHDDIGYAAIGLGGPHAAAHLMLTQFETHRNLYDAMWSVFCAKKRGEAAPGVGAETDMVIVNKVGWSYVPLEMIDELAETYEKMRKASRERDVHLSIKFGEIDEKRIAELRKKDAEEAERAASEGAEQPVREPSEGGLENPAAPAERGEDEAKGKLRQAGKTA